MYAILMWLFGTPTALGLLYLISLPVREMFERWSFEDTRDRHTTASWPSVFMRPAMAGECVARDCLCTHKRVSQASVITALHAENERRWKRLFPEPTVAA